LAQDAGVRGPHQRERHLVDEEEQSVPDQLEGDRVAEPARCRCCLRLRDGHRAPPFPELAMAIWTLPDSSRRALHPGGTTMTESYSSTRSGPERPSGGTSLRRMTGVEIHPLCGPNQASRLTDRLMPPPPSQPPSLVGGEAPRATRRTAEITTRSLRARCP